MKTKKLVTLFLCVALAVSCFCATLSVASADVPTESTLQYGEADPSTYWDQNVWIGAGNSAVARTSLREWELLTVTGFGNRMTYKARNLDLSHLKFTVDLSKQPENCVNIFTFGTYGGYIDNNGNKFNIEFFRSSTVKDTVHMVVGTGAPHNIAYSTIINENGENPITNDNTYMGINVPSLVVTFEGNLVGETYEFTLNGVKYFVPAATILATAGTWDGHALVYGTMGSTGKYSLPVSGFEDKNMRDYYAEGDAHAKFATALEALEASVETMNAETLATVKASYDAAVANYAGLSYGDNYWYATRYEAACASYNAKLAALGGAVIDVLAEDVTAYTENDALATEEEINAAIAMQTKAKEALAKMYEVELTEELEARVDAYAEAIATADAALVAAAKAVATAQLEAYEAAVEAIDSLASYKAAIAAGANVNKAFIAMQAEEEAAAFDERILACTTAISNYNEADAVTGITTTGKVFGEEEGFDFYGGRMVSNTKVNMTDFEMTFTIDQFGANTGNWFSFGIMEKPEQFSNADDPSAAENKGLFTLMTYDAAIKQVKVEIYHMTMSCGRFFDAKFLEQIIFNYEVGEDINVRLSMYTETIAGQAKDYLRISINGVTLQDTRIEKGALNTSLGIGADGMLLPEEDRYLGYLVLAMNGTHAGTVKTINKVDAKGEIPAVAGDDAYTVVSKMIAELPKGSEVTLETVDAVKAQIAEIKTAYAALSAEEQAMVTNYSAVATLEAVIANLENAGDEPGDEPGTSKPLCGSSVGGFALLAIIGCALVASKKR
ncbi:MAG: hypothetical protein IJF71_05750 [Clostridia bacterium]|nr:hypothetical protein [Clostridia bacterium]